MGKLTIRYHIISCVRFLHFNTVTDPRLGDVPSTTRRGGSRQSFHPLAEFFERARRRRPSDPTEELLESVHETRPTFREGIPPLNVPQCFVVTLYT